MIVWCVCCVVMMAAGALASCAPKQPPPPSAAHSLSANQKPHTLVSTPPLLLFLPHTLAVSPHCFASSALPTIPPHHTTTPTPHIHHQPTTPLTLLCSTPSTPQRPLIPTTTTPFHQRPCVCAGPPAWPSNNPPRCVCVQSPLPDHKREQQRHTSGQSAQEAEWRVCAVCCCWTRQYAALWRLCL